MRGSQARATRAVFVDRDGVLNHMVYNKEEGQLGSPLSPSQLEVYEYVPEAVAKVRKLGYKVVVISNQPGVAKKQFTLASHEAIGRKLRKKLAEDGSSLDGEYYCLHSPQGLIAKYRVNCDCRKPKPGLLLRAAKEMNLDLANSYFVGDGLVDVKAGQRAGCQTILVGHVSTHLSKLMETEDAEPDHILPSLKEVPALLATLEKSQD